LPQRLDLLLYVITERKYSRNRSLEELIEPCLKGGASVIQLRDKTATTKELLDKALRLRVLTERYSALFIVNDRVDVALATSADGVHLGADDMDPRLARKLLGADGVIGLTVRRSDEAKAALDLGVDYVAAGSVFESGTKRAEIIGLDGLSEICRVTSLPVVAIGGIGTENLDEVINRGASGVAVAREILDTLDIERSARRMRSALEKTVSRRSPRSAGG
jgi:thiamine-phosphate pyrophosphorylase